MPSSQSDEAPGEEEANSSLQDQILQALLDDKFSDFQQILRSGKVRADHKYVNHHYATLLEISCRRRNREKYINELLKKVKPNINHVIPEPIHHAAKRGIHEAMNALLNNKHLNVNASDSKGNTALHYLVTHYKTEEHENYVKCIHLLLYRADFNINKANNKGYTAIHQAASHKHKHIVKLLLEQCKADLDLDTSYASGKSSREFISEMYPDLAHLFPPLSYSKLPGSQSQLLVAVQNQHIDVFCGLLSQVDTDGNTLLDPNYWYERPLNATCLEMVCKDEKLGEFVKALLEAGADPNAVNRNNEKAPIHIAAEMGNHNALNILLSHCRTNVNAIDKKERTALHYALDQKEESKWHNAKQCADLLLRKSGINVNLRDNTNYTPIAIAALNDNLQAVRQLLNDRVNYVDLKMCQGNQGKTGKEIIKEKFPQLNVSDLHDTIVTAPDIMNKLEALLYKRHADQFIVEFEREVMSDESLINSSSQFLQLAISHDLDSVVNVLLTHGINPNGLDNCSEPPLVLAAKTQRHSIMRQLLNSKIKKVDMNVADMRGNTALHHAVRKEDLECCILLLNNGASINKENVLGRLPLEASELESLLDKCLKTNKKFPKHENYQVIFDYRFITAHKTEDKCHSALNNNQLATENVRTSADRNEDGMALERLFTSDPIENNCTIDVVDDNNVEENKEDSSVDGQQHSSLVMLTSEMELLHYISQNKDYKKLLHHPIITSFLKLKWECVKNIFYVNLIFYGMFVLVLNIHIWLSQQTVASNATVKNVSENASYGDIESNYFNVGKEIVFYVLILLLALLGIREFLQCVMCTARYSRNPENILDVSLVILTIIIILPPSEIINYIRPTVTVAVILLSCMELIMLTGRFPQLSLNIEMLKAVSKNYCWFLLSYAVLIVAFAHCFYILFNKATKENSGYIEHNNFFRFISYSMLKTIVMMTGEFEAGNSMAFNIMPFTSAIVFILFVFFIAIVLLNLLIGLTVNDTQAIQNKSKILCIASRINVIFEIESVVIECHKNFKRLFNNCTYIDKWLEGIIFFPTGEHDKLIETLPNCKGIIQNPCRKNCKIDSYILEEAIRIISNRGKQYDKPEETVSQKIENLQKSLNDMMKTLVSLSNQMDSLARTDEIDNGKIQRIGSQMK